MGDEAFELSEAGGLQVLAGAPAASYDYRPGPRWRYYEQLGFRDQLTLVGDGHVSRARALDFEITVLDIRPDLPTLAAKDDAHHRHVLSSYEALAAAASPGPHRYVVVMTVGYRDAVGVISSAAKMAELRRMLAKGGFPATELIQLRGPIRTINNSRTPDKTIVSVAADTNCGA